MHSHTEPRNVQEREALAQTCIRRPSPKALDFNAGRIRDGSSRSEWSARIATEAERSKSGDVPSAVAVS